MSSSEPQSSADNKPQTNAGAAAGPVPLYRHPVFWVVVGMLAALAVLLLLRGCNRPAELPVDPPAADADKGNAQDDRLAELLALQRAHNKGLEEELARLQGLMREDPCALAGLLGPSPAEAPIAPDYTPLPPTGNGTLPPTGNGTLPPSPGTTPELAPAQPPSTVADLMEQATVFVLSEYEGVVGMGSGFFVAPGIIATNRHVVQGNSARVLVGNKALGGMTEASILAYSNNESRDYALLRIDNSLAGRTPVLRLAQGANRTEKISAWGFPGYITEIDPKLQALALGDPKAVPEVVYSEGVVSVVLDHTPPAILHTAAISQGNSGGPLINSQGVVVGINTFIKKADQSYSQTNIALPGADLAAFMHEHGITTAAPVK